LVDTLNDALDKGGIELAVKNFREFDSDPLNKYASVEDTLLNVGQRLLNEKKPGDALKLFLFDKEKNPASFRAYYAIGAAYSEMGNKQPAIENLEQALKLDPKNYGVAQLLKDLQQK
jgi:tetratricopeptide (TPR) repeat protein